MRCSEFKQPREEKLACYPLQNVRTPADLLLVWRVNRRTDRKDRFSQPFRSKFLLSSQRNLKQCLCIEMILGSKLG